MCPGCSFPPPRSSSSRPWSPEATPSGHSVTIGPAQSTQARFEQRCLRDLSAIGDSLLTHGSKPLTIRADPYADDLVYELENEWDQIALPRVDIRAWQTAFEGAAAEYVEIRARGAWVSGRADFFGVLRLGRAELTHSAMLAWLLDPDGRHGFGRRLLDHLVENHITDLDPASFRVRDVECEVQRLETRADIIVWGDTATIIIEVKVGAGEGLRQCDRLYERFADNPNPRFVFLTPSGRRPLTATGEAADAFVAMSFVDIRQVLDAVLAQGSDGDGAGVAVDYVRTLREEFG
jgi:hypothetical protein